MKQKKGKLIFIVNPLSSNGKSKKIVTKIERDLRDLDFDYDIFYTEYQGHAVELVKQIKSYSNIDALIAIGGDGTINEVINGLYPSSIALGYIPAGSGNDFAKHMKIPTNSTDALKKILDGNIKLIDIGQINQRLFVNVAGIGLDAEVTKIANNSSYKRLFGKTVYVYGLIKGLITYKPQNVRIILDEKNYSFEKVWFVSIANNKYFGGGMLISPNANNQDGELDICVIKDLSRLRLISLFPTIFSGKHLRYKDNVIMLKGKNIRVEVDKGIPIQADGEILNEANITVKVIQKSLYVIN